MCGKVGWASQKVESDEWRRRKRQEGGGERGKEGKGVKEGREGEEGCGIGLRVGGSTLKPGK